MKAQEALTALVRDWQKRLRLQDWDIEIRVARTSEMHHKDCAAEVHTFQRKRRAIIYISAAEDYEANNANGIFDVGPHDIEYSIVHELMHVLLWPCEIRTSKEIQEEQAVHALATALLAEHRGHQKGKKT